MAVVEIYALSVDAKGTIAKSRIGTTVKEEYRVVDDYFYNNVPGFMNSLVSSSPVWDGNVQRSLALGSPHPGSSNAVLKSISAKRTGSDKQEGGPFVWNVTLEYAPEDETEQSKRNEVTRITVFTETNNDTDGRRDWLGNLNVNSAGEFFADKLPLKNVLVIIRYQVNYINNPNADLKNVVWHTNADAWCGLGAGTCLVRSISTEREKDEDGFYYWRTTLEIAHNPKGWLFQKPDCGFYDNHGRILDEIGAPVERAKLLNGLGELLDDIEHPVLRDFTLFPVCNFTETFDYLPDPFADYAPISGGEGGGA
ncbi:MAG: hypothetical protein K6E55_10680 [Thermoguttaceae bacterium]|nr:hypothetical protein [Thermoguttaceae bacterium]